MKRDWKRTKTCRGRVVENEQEESFRIMRKKSRRNRIEGRQGGEEKVDEEEEEEEAHPCIVALDCPSVRLVVQPSNRPSVHPGRSVPGTKGWTDRRLRAFQIHSRRNSVRRGSSSASPGAVINYDRNRRIHARAHGARIVGHSRRSAGFETLLPSSGSRLPRPIHEPRCWWTENPLVPRVVAN